jgi:hypothetical protein
MMTTATPQAARRLAACSAPWCGQKADNCSIV